MKYLPLLLIFCSCGTLEDLHIIPTTRTYCENLLIRKESCKDCYSITTKNTLPTPEWINLMEGCELGYRTTGWSYTFTINPTYNRRKVLRNIKTQAKRLYCD